jgi:hypothetical protein
MNERVTAEDWNKVFQSEVQPETRDKLTPEIAMTMAMGTMALIESIHCKYQVIKHAEHIPANGRVAKIIALVDALRDQHKILARTAHGLYRDVKQSSNVLLQCEILHLIRNLALVDELIFSNKKTKEVHKMLYKSIQNQAHIGSVSIIRSMLRVGSLSPAVRKQLHGTPLSDNLSFMRTLNPKAADDWNLGKISARLVKMNEKIDKNSPAERGSTGARITHIHLKCDECGTFFTESPSAGFHGTKFNICSKCLKTQSML